MNFNEVYDKMKNLEDNGRVEDKEVFEDKISLFWAEFVDVIINGQVILTSSIVLDKATVEIFGAIGFKSYELEEIWEFDVDV
jgi:hypothetical protein